MSTNPMAILVVTEIMARAQKLKSAADIIFVDSTASCTPENNSITFVLSCCPAGAVPIAVIITEGQRESDYTAGFKLLKEFNAASFGGQQEPRVFMIDDSTAEYNTLEKLFPTALKALCWFHVQQAHWRWLWDAHNKIQQNDRQEAIEQFRIIMRSTSKEEAEEAYDMFLASHLCQKYPNWAERLKSYWARKERWCLAWRGAEFRGNHTNNFSEVTVRLFKDIVLSRCKAYNAVALVDFIVTVQEDYYRNRLRDFAHSRARKTELLLQKKTKPSASQSPNTVEKIDEDIFQVPSFTKESVKYIVDVNNGTCTCEDGICGRFCKHQGAIYRYFSDVVLKNVPPCTTEDRYTAALLAFGNLAQEREFYEPLLNINNKPASANCSSADFAVTSNSTTIRDREETVATAEIMDCSEPSGSSSCESALKSNGSIDILLKLFQEKHRQFETSDGALDKYIRRMQMVQTQSQWETFLHTGGHAVPLQRHCGQIKVQPTSISRRSAGVSRGCKRLPSGRPPQGWKKQRPKRPHNLALSIKCNRPNAKSHGEGH